ncbi:MAG: hypothetical protein IKR13_06250, partial [Victivallales bacterium]|nr:hypothetical protein [Victivallales bacterium]
MPNVPKETLEDIFEEYYRILSWALTLNQDDKEAMRNFTMSRRKLQRRVAKGSFLKFLLNYQFEGKDSPERWMDDLVQWLAAHPDESKLLKYTHELLSFTHITDQPSDKTQMMLLEECINKLDKPLADPWLLHVARASNAWRRAWKGRGGGYADSVSQAGWDVWKVEKKRALEESRKAVALHPDWPGAYLGILEDFGGNHVPEFLQVIQYRPDYVDAYRKTIWGLLPRWGGSHAQIAALARVCMETRRYDTALPSIGFNLLGLIAGDISWSQWSRPYRQKWLEPLARELFDARIQRASWLKRDFRLDKALFLHAISKYDEAAALMKAVEADNGGKPIVFPTWDGHHIGNWYPKVPSWEDVPTHLRLMTGPHAATLREIEELARDSQKVQEAISRMSEFLKSNSDLKENEREYLADLRARWQMPKIESDSYYRQRGWGVAISPAFKNGYTKVIRELFDAGVDYKKFEYYPGHMANYIARTGTYPDMLDLLKEMGDPLNRP